MNSKLTLQWWSLWEAQSTLTLLLESPCGSAGKESACNAGDLGSIPGLGRSPEEGKGNPLQYSGLENSMDRGAWQATVHVVTKSQIRLSDCPFKAKLGCVPSSPMLIIIFILCKTESVPRAFPGGPAAKTQCFHCRGTDFNPRLRN